MAEQDEAKPASAERVVVHFGDGRHRVGEVLHRKGNNLVVRFDDNGREEPVALAVPHPCLGSL